MTFRSEIRGSALRAMCFCIAGALLTCCAAIPQTGAPETEKTTTSTLAYEVVSIRPVKSGGVGSIFSRFLKDGFSAHGINLGNLVWAAYYTKLLNQVRGLPGWAHSEMYDVEARMSPATMAALEKRPPVGPYSPNQLLLQTMLAERFHLKVHIETRQGLLYDLVVAKGGIKMKPSAAGEKSGMWGGGFQLTGRATTVEGLAGMLPVGRIVVDKTGLTGKYDFTLKWTPFDQEGQADAGPSIFTALQEQLGLKLVPAKGPVEALVVDHVERPSAN